MARSKWRRLRRKIGWLVFVCVFVVFCVRVAIETRLAAVSFSVGIEIRNAPDHWSKLDRIFSVSIGETSARTTWPVTTQAPQQQTTQVFIPTEEQTTKVVHDIIRDGMGGEPEESDASPTSIGLDGLASSAENRKGAGETSAAGHKDEPLTAEALLKESEELFMARMGRRMKRRRKEVEEKCRKLGINPSNSTIKPWHNALPQPTPWFLTSPKHRLIYCEVPKVGSTNWKKVLMVLNGMANSTSDIKQGQAHSAKLDFVKFMPDSETLRAYKGSLKMMVVRDPLERLTSAFVDKILTSSEKQSSVFTRFSYEVARKYGKRWKDESRDLGNGWKQIVACRAMVATLECNQPGHVIKVGSAMFGRQDDVTCKDDFTSVMTHVRKCTSPSSLFVTSQLCDGKASCQVAASPALFAGMNGCGTAPNYLDVTYKCVDISAMQEITVCQNGVQKLECQEGERIHVGSAFYGRTETKTCATTGKEHNTQCESKTASSAVLLACHLRQSCLLNASAEWIQSDPCPSTWKYLKVWYSCKKGKSLRNDQLHKGSDAPAIYRPPKNFYRKYSLQATFDEFVSYLIDPANSDVAKDSVQHGSPSARTIEVRHWQNYQTLCYPCHVKYDVIARMETINEDARYVLKLIGAPASLTFPVGYKMSGQSLTSRSTAIDWLSRISASDLSRLVELYHDDFQLFGYEPPAVHLP